ncbi:hypothetical protein AB0J63_06985 [Streptosporangium canum]|uniref:hypothetical protein n=1 Tax=Streptosporangium canum TaxID=324952 RepID=UPI003442EBF5
MRGKRRLTLLGPALLAVVALGPAVAAEASTAPGSANTTTAGALENAASTTAFSIKPPKKQYNKGYQMGFSEGRADCRNRKPYDLNSQGGGAFNNGYRDGYNSGFHSCTPGAPSPTAPMTPAPTPTPTKT